MADPRFFPPASRQSLAAIAAAAGATLIGDADRRFTGVAPLQSAGQVLALSGGVQAPSPQLVVGWQSCGQLTVFSGNTQEPSPQVGCGGQSVGQVFEVSPFSQTPLPQ